MHKGARKYDMWMVVNANLMVKEIVRSNYCSTG